MTVRPEVLVIDTNVIVSAILFRKSLPRLALTKALTESRILSSSATRNELRDVISRSKFDRVGPVHLRLQEVEVLIEETYSVEIVERISVCRDLKDDKLLELAVNGRADAIITGDADIRVLHPFRGIQIMTPAEFLGL